MTNTERASSTTTPPQARPVTPNDLLASAQRLLARLDRHLDALEAGNVDAVDDLAAVLRTLVVRGKGNDAIRRLCKTFNQPYPHVYVSRQPVDDREIVLAFGSVPCNTAENKPPAEATGSWITIDRWTDQTALIARGATRRVSTWNHLISAYANTYGSHLSGTIPDILTKTSSMWSDRLDLGGYLIHCAGLVVEDALTQLLDQIAGKPLSVPRRNHRPLNPMNGLTVSDSIRPMGYVGASFAGDGVLESVDLIKLRNAIGTHYLRIRLEPVTHGTDRDGHHLVLQGEDKEPDWWPPRVN